MPGTLQSKFQILSMTAVAVSLQLAPMAFVPLNAWSAPAGNLGSDAGFLASLSLYNRKQYAAAAAAFEALIANGKTGSRLYYYAALANRDSGKVLRARQLFQYVGTAFPRSPEAPLSIAAAAKLAPAAAAAPALELPESVRNALPPEMQALLNSDAGKAALKQALQGQAQNIAVVKKAETQGLLSKEVTKKIARPIIASATPKVEVPHKLNDHPFSAADIAKDGAGGIDQMRYGNCWFEASMSALAELPRGQKLLSDMVRWTEKDGYVVRFPNDGNEYIISQDTIDQSQIKDKALWASVIECAQIQKFPDNAGAQGTYDDQSRLEVGLQCITGCKAEIISPETASVQDLSMFIGGAVKSKNPIVASTWNPAKIMNRNLVVIPLHAYTIVDFDPSKNMVVMRNPHGENSQKFELEDDPNHLQFEQMDDGKFKIGLPLVQKYFYQVCRSFI